MSHGSLGEADIISFQWVWNVTPLCLFKPHCCRLGTTRLGNSSIAETIKIHTHTPKPWVKVKHVRINAQGSDVCNIISLEALQAAWKKIIRALKWWIFSWMLFTGMRCNPASSNCRVTSQKICIKWVYPPLCPQHGWNVMLNAKLNGVITAIWWNTAEFKWSCVADAELNMNTKSKLKGEGWCDSWKRSLRMKES